MEIFAPSIDHSTVSWGLPPPPFFVLTTFCASSVKLPTATMSAAERNVRTAVMEPPVSVDLAVAALSGHRTPP